MKKDIEEELDILNDTVEVLVDLLVKKGILIEKEWNDEVKKKLKENEKLVKFRDLEE